MKEAPPTPRNKTNHVKDYLTVIENASELFELYNAHNQLEILKGKLLKKRGTNKDDVKILAEITLACQLQELCKRRV